MIPNGNLPPHARWSWRWALLAGLGLATCVIVLAVVWMRRDRTTRGEIQTIYRNARPGVKYVGSRSCAECHAEIAKTYFQHPMGRSIAPISEGTPELKGDANPDDLFQALGLDYLLERRDGRTYHREVKRLGDGTVLATVEGEVKYTLGSGRHAYAFLIQRDDFLFQSPVTRYTQSGHWGLAPGFEARDARFERQITPTCLVCHANQVHHVPGSQGRYQEPIFSEGSIGCERCHGPGELHLAQPVEDASGPNIVNPRKLEPELREDVCRQCHLIGSSTVERYGRKLSEFRPGLPYGEFITVFVNKDDAKANHPNADHVEQMERSRCYLASQGRLGCISCHNPHELPATEARVGYYRDRCMKCHEQKGCSLPLEGRLRESKQDSCIQCHMPRAPTSDVPHVTTTLHSIPRVGGQGLAALQEATRERPLTAEGLAIFHQDSLSPERLKSVPRDLGVALRHERPQAAKVLSGLERAVTEHPDDLLARESLGFVNWALRQDEKALAHFEQVLKVEPRRESSLEAMALVASELRRYELSTELWHRAIAVDPWRSSFSAELAFDLSRLRKWPEAIAAARACLMLNPASKTARETLILALIRTGAREEAGNELRLLQEWNPRERDALTDWFQSLR